MISDSKLDFYVQNNLNVLLIGRHGTGKTSRVKKCFERHNLKALYFSVSTMDPWVDFVGIPKEVTDEKGITYLDLIRPKAFAYDQVEAIFLDEYNRGSEKVRNATLELIQYRSINGKKFNNLRFVWAAINPDDDINCYDVQKLDLAQKDRFHIHIDIPYELDMDYFADKYGTQVANRVQDWWNDLAENIKSIVSPRRVDYALEVYLHMNGDLKDVLPVAANVAHLANVLEKDSVKVRLESIMKSGNAKLAEPILKNDTEYQEAIKWILLDKARCNFFLPIINHEKYRALVAEHINNENILKNIASPFDISPSIRKILLDCHKNNEFKNSVLEAIPEATSDNFSKNVRSVQIFNPQKGCNPGFFDKINEFSSIDTSIHERKEMMKWIMENIGTTTKGKNGDAVTTMMFIGKQMYKTVDKKVLLKEFPDMIPVLNCCLKTIDGGIDIRKDKRFKLLGKAIVRLGVEDLVWTPGCEE